MTNHINHANIRTASLLRKGWGDNQPVDGITYVNSSPYIVIFEFQLLKHWKQYFPFLTTKHVTELKVNMVYLSYETHLYKQQGQCAAVSKGRDWNNLSIT